jgi:hypothetical protein
VLWIRIRADQELFAGSGKNHNPVPKNLHLYNLSTKCTIKKLFLKIQFNLYIVVISAMKCEFDVQLSHSGDRFTDNNTGSGSETHFKVGSETGAEINHSTSTTSYLCTGIGTVHNAHYVPVLRIRIHTFLALLDPDPLVRGMDPDPDPALLLFDFLSLKNDIKVPSKSNLQKTFFFKLVFCWHLEGQ